MELVNNRYTIGGVDALSLVEEFGAPIYVYDTAIIRRQYEMLDTAFSGVRHKIKYACKALNNISILKFIRSLGAGLDAVSLNEIHLAMQAGFTSQEIMYTPNCVSFEELKQAVALGVAMNIDNLPLLEQFGKEYGGSIPLCIRINPHIMAGGNLKISTGHVDSKFGVSVHQLEELLAVVEAHSINVVAVHMHTGSEIADAEIILKGAEILIEMARNFPNLQYLDFGGGMKVAYKPGDKAVPTLDIGAKLAERVNEFSKERGREIEVWLEPGKFLVSEAGTFLVRTNVVKRTPARTFAGVDSGLNHLIRPMFYDAYHHIANISNLTGTQQQYTVCGYICETDNFAWDRDLAEVREGDVLAFHNAGAYGFTMSSQYNARPRPAEVLVHNGKAHLIRTRETLEDILRNQIVVEL